MASPSLSVEQAEALIRRWLLLPRRRSALLESAALGTLLTQIREQLPAGELPDLLTRLHGRTLEPFERGWHHLVGWVQRAREKHLKNPPSKNSPYPAGEAPCC